jgi:predicted ABC-type transport system involved in lysophospholipase L1 biosynthesis ATPase subunit
MSLVEFKGVSYSDEAGPVLRDVDLAFGSGERIVVTGTDGTGTSAFMKLLAGLVAPEAGTVSVLGKDLFSKDGGRASADDLEEVRTSMGLIFSDFSLISNLKVIENVALPMVYHRDLARQASLERAGELLKAAGYDGDVWTLPGPLPDYETRVVSVARAVSLSPRLVAAEDILDGLDEKHKVLIADSLLRYHWGDPEGLLIVTVSDVGDAEYFKPTRVVRRQGQGFTG